MAKGFAAGCLPFHLALLAAVALCGCSSHHRGAMTVTTSGKHMDSSWLTALNTCWPQLGQQGYSTEALRRDLADGDAFHHAFPVYTALSNADLDGILAKPIEAAPKPDVSRLAHSPYPILNQLQAAAGANKQQAVVQSTDGIAPPDAFCAIQPGAPQGFRK